MLNMYFFCLALVSGLLWRHLAMALRVTESPTDAFANNLHDVMHQFEAQEFMDDVTDNGRIAAALIEDVLTHESDELPAGCSASAFEALSDMPKYVLNVDRHNERFMQFAMNNALQGAAFANTCRVQAVDGANCPDIITSDEIPVPMAQKMAGPIAVSHMAIWRYIYDNEIPVALVMEDDALAGCVPHFLEYMCAAVDNLSEYDYFRPNHLPMDLMDGHERWDPEQIQHAKHNLQNDSWVGSTFSPNRNLRETCRDYFATDIYIATYEFAKNALETYDIYSMGLVDNFTNFAPDARFGCYDVPIASTSGLTRKSSLSNSENQHPEVMHEQVTDPFLRMEGARAIKDCADPHLLHQCWTFEQLTCLESEDCDQTALAAVEEPTDY